MARASGALTSVLYQKMPKLIFDIETAGDDFDELDETTRKMLTRWVEKAHAPGSDEYKKAIENIKQDLVFSPLTSQVVAIGVLDYEREKGVVYFQAPGEKIKPFEEDGIEFKPAAEKEMLEGFWRGAENYGEFISFNGRGFDVPFMMIRSAVHEVRPTKNLIGARYLYQHPPGAVHVDLQEQMTFYGAVRRQGMSLHMFARAFGIKSPKESGISGDNVTELFRNKKYVDIAKYNVGDLWATKELYDYWNKYLRF